MANPPQQPPLTPPTDVPGPIPEDNLPGHHPEVEQDKPTGPPPRRRRKAEPTVRHWKLRRDEPFAAASRVFGVTDDNGYVAVEDDQLQVQFGPWQLKTPLSNVAAVDVTGPYAWWKVIGPPHVSLRDRGITFATSDRGGVCIHFKEAVRAVDAFGVLRHPAATVSVENPKEVARLIGESLP